MGHGSKEEMDNMSYSSFMLVLFKVAGDAFHKLNLEGKI